MPSMMKPAETPALNVRTTNAEPPLTGESSTARLTGLRIARCDHDFLCSHLIDAHILLGRTFSSVEIGRGQ